MSECLFLFEPPAKFKQSSNKEIFIDLMVCMYEAAMAGFHRPYFGGGGQPPMWSFSAKTSAKTKELGAVGVGCVLAGVPGIYFQKRHIIPGV